MTDTTPMLERMARAVFALWNDGAWEDARQNVKDESFLTVDAILSVLEAPSEKACLSGAECHGAAFNSSASDECFEIFVAMGKAIRGGA